MKSKFDLKGTYRRWARQAGSGRSRVEGLKVAIGGQFEAYGRIEVDMLRFFGPRDHATLIDVGCGSGRAVEVY